MARVIEWIASSSVRAPSFFGNGGTRTRMDYDGFGEPALFFYPGEWVALWRGRVVAHGPDYMEVVLEACRRAPDAVIERLPEVPSWEPDCPPWT